MVNMKCLWTLCPRMMNMATTDWTDKLAALRATLPDAEITSDEQSEVTTPNHTNLTATLFYERKGRGGRPATIITGLESLDDADISTLASDLKKALATGGATRGGEILLQGDCRIQLRKLLSQKGFKVKG